MKLLLLAANPDTSSNLSLEREITTLQRRFINDLPDFFEFIPLPDLRVEELPHILRRVKPDILHVTAHGEVSHLVLADTGGAAVEITPERLATFLSPDKPPKLVYFGGCKSAGMAKSILGIVAMAVGTAATIGNGPARAAAVSFYECVLGGDNVQVAFAAAKSMAGVVGNVDLELYVREGVDPAREVLRPRPRLTARFARVRKGSDNTFPIRVGVSQCPRSTTQLIAFFEGDAAPCVSTRPEWTGGTAWLRVELRIDADRRLFVVGLVGGAGRFIVEARLCEALTGTEREDVSWAIKQLTQYSTPSCQREG